jgi:serine protease Do
MRPPLRRLLAVTVLGLPVAPDHGWGDSPREVIASAATKVVKIYGAGGMRGLEGYQSGILVSPDGTIATAATTVLDTDEIDCVLDDGRRYRARLVGVDPRRELAVLVIDAEGLPAFAWDAAERAAVGTRVIALSNLFNVAVGDERVSAQRGVVSAVVPLEARRGAAEAPYRGDVYVLDCTTNNPGSAGGALVDARGRLVGMLGKELRATASGIWLNYALPTDQLEKGCAEIKAGTAAAVPADEARPFDPRRLGVVLVPDLLDRTPPYVESLVPGSSAARAGLAVDDLVIAVNGRAVAARAAVEAALGGLAAGDPVRLTVVRDGAVLDLELGPRPRDEVAP